VLEVEEPAHSTVMSVLDKGDELDPHLGAQRSVPEIEQLAHYPKPPAFSEYRSADDKPLEGVLRFGLQFQCRRGTDLLSCALVQYASLGLPFLRAPRGCDMRIHNDLVIRLLRYPEYGYCAGGVCLLTNTDDYKTSSLFSCDG
jgi:hypothetical protein